MSEYQGNARFYRHLNDSGRSFRDPESWNIIETTGFISIPVILNRHSGTQNHKIPRKRQVFIGFWWFWVAIYPAKTIFLQNNSSGIKSQPLWQCKNCLANCFIGSNYQESFWSALEKEWFWIKSYFLPWTIFPIIDFWTLWKNSNCFSEHPVHPSRWYFLGFFSQKKLRQNDFNGIYIYWIMNCSRIFIYIREFPKGGKKWGIPPFCGEFPPFPPISPPPMPPLSI